MVNKRRLVVVILAVIALAGVAQAATWVDKWAQMYLTEEEKQLDSRTDLVTTVSVGGVSNYIWRGFDMFDDRGAVQPSVNFDWYGTGINTMVWSAYPLTGEIKDRTEYRYIVGYTDCLWGDSLYATKYTVSWTYYDFIRLQSKERDAQEIGIQLSWPKAYMDGDTRLVPSYYVGKLWPAQSNAENRDSGGWIHILGLNYEFWLFGQGAERQLMCLSSELVYNDGMFGADHEWSDVVFGIGTTLREGALTVKPEIKYQISMDESVNSEDELWGGMTISYKF